MPTVFRHGRYRFFFFSREETRRHIHVSSQTGEAKIWLEPAVALSKSVNFSQSEINEALRIVKDNLEEINAKWNEHFGA